jgi:hypothetical protein
LISSGKNPGNIASFLSEELMSCYKWLIDNKLTLHVSKTECLIFGTKRKLKNVDFHVFCNGSLVERVTSVKYLGVILDQTPSGVQHVQSILKKAGSRLAFLFRYSAILNQRARLTICSALVQPNFDYCCSTWFSSLTAAYKTKLAVIQRRMVRFVLGMNPRDHVGQQEFRKLSWLTIENRVDYFKTAFLQN